MTWVETWPSVPVVRVAGVTVPALDTVTFPRSTAVAEHLVEAAEWLATEGQCIAEQLQYVIRDLPRTRRQGLKPVVVALRRRMHQGRLPSSREWSQAVEAALPRRLASRVAAWVDRYHQRATDQQRLASLLAAEAAERRASLRDAVADPTFRRGLLHASPVLSNELDKWLADSTHRPGPKVIFRLAKYLARAATKTSPFSTFTVQGFTSWGVERAGPAVCLAEESGLREATELYESVRTWLVESLTLDPRLRAALSVRLNPSVSRTSDQLLFLGRPPHEPCVTVQVTPAVETVLGKVGPGTTTTLGHLRASLIGAAGAQGQGEEVGATIDRFLGHLHDIGLLDVRPASVGGGSDPWGELASWIDKACSDLSDVAAILRRMNESVRARVPLADISAHRARHRVAATAVEDIADRLGVPPPVPTGASVAREDIVGDHLATCRPDSWWPILRDLDTMRSWLPLLDDTMPFKLAASDWFAAHFGSTAQVPLLQFYRQIQEEISSGPGSGDDVWQPADPAGPATLAPNGSARVREWAGLRRTVADALGGEGRETGGVVQVASEFLAGLVAPLPEWLPAIDSLGCYVQPVGEGVDGTAAVLNAVDTGFGKGRSRTAHLVEQSAGERHRAGAADQELPSSVVAELPAAPGASLDSRSPTVPLQIEYPFIESSYPLDRRLRLDELAVGLDPRRGLLCLRVDHTGTELTVPHLSLVHSERLPPAAKLITRLFGPTGIERGPPLGKLSWFRPVAVVTYEPRVQIGRVTVRRARWIVPESQVLVRAAGETDADFLVRVTEFRHRHGIPTRCFVRTLPAVLEPRDLPARRQLAKKFRPMYVDFSNWFLLLALENAIRAHRQVVIFEEALPDPGREGKNGTRSRVVELLVEVPTHGRAVETLRGSGYWVAQGSVKELEQRARAGSTPTNPG